MRLTPIARRRARATLLVVGVVLAALLVAGVVVPAVLLVMATPALVYRATGSSWRQALAWTVGRPPVAPRASAQPQAQARASVAAARPANPRLAIATVVVVVPAGLGLLSAGAGWLTGSDEAVVAVGMLVTLTWTAAAAMVSGLVVRDTRRRTRIACAAGVATIVAVVVAANLLLGG